MGFLTFWRGSKDKNDKKPAFDHKLIGKFQKDHQKLFAQVEQIQKELQEPVVRSHKIRSTLKALRLQLMGHFMEEDIKLYWYLKEYYKDNPSILSVVKEFESSIKDIQKEVMRFFDMYTIETAEYDAAFEKSFSEIVVALTSRIESEESNLYTLYQKA